MDNLVLERFNENDFHFYAEIASDPYVTQWIDNMTLDRQNFLSTIKSEANWHYKIIVSGKNVGLISINHLESDNLECELAYAVLPKFQGNGIATQAIRKVLDYLKNNSYSIVYARVDPKNYGSIKALYKTGFTDYAFESGENKFHKYKFEILFKLVLFPDFEFKNISEEGWAKVRYCCELSEKLAAEKKFQDAINQMSQAIEINPNSPGMYFQRGILFFQKAKDRTNVYEAFAAVRDFTRAIFGAEGRKEFLFAYYCRAVFKLLKLRSSH